MHVRRRLGALPALAAAAGVLAFSFHATASGAPGAGSDLLPNLVELPPTDIAVAQIAEATPPRWELRFTSIAGNSGEGPLAVVAVRASAAEAFTVVQRVSRRGGPPRSLPLRVSLSYIDAAGHDHFHLARFERYELRDASGKLLARDTKAGYCLGDRARLGTAAANARYTGACARGNPGALRLDEGISVGWADPYGEYLPGQSFPLSGLLGGVYTLVNRVNDLSLYLESSLRDNVAAAKLRLAWPDGPDGKPVVTVLGTCLAERCP